MQQHTRLAALYSCRSAQESALRAFPRRVDRDQRSRRRRPAQPGAMILGNSAIDRLGLMQQLISVFKAGRSPCDIAVSIHRTRSQPRPRRRMICSVMPGGPSLPAPILTPALDDELLERPGDQREDRARPLDNLLSLRCRLVRSPCSNVCRSVAQRIDAWCRTCRQRRGFVARRPKGGSDASGRKK